MGKTQSKRSVDITTDSKLVSKDAEFPDKMEKIDDVMEQKEVVNGDTIMTEKFNQDKQETDLKNGKNVDFDKNGVETGNSNKENEDAQAAGNANVLKDTSMVGDTATKHGGEVATVTGADSAADESLKKSKMEKVKKKWSFRSISFGKKDKQKPVKNEQISENAAENVVATAAINGISEEKADVPSIKGEADNALAAGTDAEEMTATVNIEEEHLGNIPVQEAVKNEEVLLTEPEVKMPETTEEQSVNAMNVVEEENHVKEEDKKSSALKSEQINDIGNHNNLASEIDEKNKLVVVSNEFEEETMASVMANDDGANNGEIHVEKGCNGGDKYEKNFSNENVPAISTNEVKNNVALVKENSNENNLQLQLNGTICSETGNDNANERMNINQNKEKDKEECKEVQSQEDDEEEEEEVVTKNERDVMKTEKNSGTNMLLLDDQIDENIQVLTVDADNKETNEELLPLEEHAAVVVAINNQEMGHVTNERDEETKLSNEVFGESCQENMAAVQIEEEKDDVVVETTNTFIVDNQMTTVLENRKLEFECDNSIQDMDNGCIREAENLNEIAYEKTNEKLIVCDITEVKNELMDVAEEEEHNNSAGYQLTKLSEQSDGAQNPEIFEKLHYIIDDGNDKDKDNGNNNNNLIDAAKILVGDVVQTAMEIVAMTITEQEKPSIALSNEDDINHINQDTEVGKESPIDMKVPSVECIDIKNEGQMQEICCPEESAIATADMVDTSVMGEKMISDNVAVNIAAGNATEPIH